MRLLRECREESGGSKTGKKKESFIQTTQDEVAREESTHLSESRSKQKCFEAAGEMLLLLKPPPGVSKKTGDPDQSSLRDSASYCVIYASF